MLILPHLAKLLQQPGGPKEWIEAQDLSFASRFEDRLLSEGPAEQEPLQILTARYTRLETALDVYHWLLSGDYARPSAIFGEASRLARSVEDFVDESIEFDIEVLFPEASSSEKRKHALQKSKCIYAILKLVHTALVTYRR